MQFIERIKIRPMKPAVLHILAAGILLVCLSSCSKSAATNTSQNKSKTVLFTQAAWKVQTVALDANKDGIADGDATSLIAGCKLDNTYSFKTDGTGTMDEAALKCNAADPQTLPLSWTFKNNETVLSGSFSFTSGDATIVTLDDNTLVVTYDDNFGTATTYHLIATLKH